MVKRSTLVLTHSDSRCTGNLSHPAYSYYRIPSDDYDIVRGRHDEV